MQARISLAIALGAVVTSPVALGATGDVTRVSLPVSGMQLTGASAAAEGSALSADGRHALFASAGPFSGALTGGVTQLFTTDLATGAVRLVSASSTGAAAASGIDDDPGGAFAPYGTSHDGRFVVFASTSASLTPSDTNVRQRDVFRKDMLTGGITIVSRDSRGAQPPLGVTGEPSISADGARVAFTSGTDPLTADDTNGVPDIYVADLRARTITLVSRTATGVQSPVAVGHPSISADGRSVAFDGPAAAAPLAADDTDGRADVYVARPATRAITVASVPPSGADTDASLPSLSGDGTRVAYLMAGSGTQVRDLPARTTTVVPQSSTTGRPGISSDGARVAFLDTRATPAVSVYALATASTTRASQTAAGLTLRSAASRPALSGNGAVAAFGFDDATGLPGASALPTPVPGDTNERPDVFATQMGPGDVTPPAVSARATASGAKIVIAGRATDASGVIDVQVAGRRAAVTDDGGFSVSLTPSVGPVSVAVTARDGVGLTSGIGVATDRAWAAAMRATTPARPRALRVIVRGRTAEVRFRTAVAGLCRVELRQRTSVRDIHAPSYRLLAARQLRRGAGRHVVRLRLPASVRSAYAYQVRVTMSSSRGLGTAATSFIMR